jgi:hypothetical protein
MSFAVKREKAAFHPRLWPFAQLGAATRELAFLNELAHGICWML